MSGFEVIITIAGLLLLIQLFIERVTTIVHRWRKLVAAAREPLPPAQQPAALPDARSTNASGLAVRSNAE